MFYISPVVLSPLLQLTDFLVTNYQSMLVVSTLPLTGFFFVCCAFHFLQFISMLFLRFLFRFLSLRFHHEYSLQIPKKVDGNLFMSHTPLGPLKCLIPLPFPSSFYFTHSLFLFSHYLLSFVHLSICRQTKPQLMHFLRTLHFS